MGTRVWPSAHVLRAHPVHASLCTPSSPSPSHRHTVKLLLTFVSFIIRGLSSATLSQTNARAYNMQTHDVNATFLDVSNRQCVFTCVYTISRQTVGQSNHETKDIRIREREKERERGME